MSRKLSTFQAYKNDLMQQAEAPLACRELDNSISLAKYLHLARQLVQQANNYKRDEEYEQYYIYSIRFVTLFVNVIKKHNSVNNIQFRREMFDMRKLCDEVLTNCEQIAKKRACTSI
jgi:hypothetical protein